MENIKKLVEKFGGSSIEVDEVEGVVRAGGEPTYTFEVGDRVKCGNLLNCRIEQVLLDGRAYLMYYEHKVKKNWTEEIESSKRVVTWLDVRPIVNKDTDNLYNDVNIKLEFQNSSIGGLFTYYYSFGIDMDPDYQRDYVWNQSDQEKLIDSVFNCIDIGKFVLVSAKSDHNMYQVVDGKQRLRALTNFYENRFPYKGRYYNELSNYDKRKFENHAISLARINNMSREEILQYFIMLNTTGRAMESKHLEKVRVLLEEERKHV